MADHMAEHLGVKVKTAPVPPGWWGLYDHPRRTVVLRPNLAPIQRRCTLMHELGHAYYGHEGVTGKQELQANRWAARQLLTLDDVARAARIETRCAALAHDLQVLPSTLDVFMDSLCDDELQALAMALHPSREYSAVG
ncbi:ImmA/IrrE family metallo-endopeptidase [Zhihengliuella halotolerans]|uniref:ImmA/IrrE family metallo-endopeptidase n=1 Tax=Zhihengliuella halotolerans TaxID=370736 RepID=UPI0015E1190D|nr:ImmA/IrrE family metallo-endopeptidase [Zhihengliuella halotolerans]